MAFSAGHYFGVNDVLEVTLVCKDVVDEVPMIWTKDASRLF